MIRIIILFIAISTSGYSCTNYKEKSISQPADSTAPSISEVFIEGTFCKIDQVSERSYNLFLKVKGDSCEVFKTVMSIGEAEISRLKKNGPNIKLAYYEYWNPSEKRKEKMAKMMIPIYE